METAEQRALVHSGGIRRAVILGHKGFIGGNLYSFFKTHSPEVEVLGRDFPEVDLTRVEDAEKLGTVFDTHTAIVICAAIKKQLGDNLEAFTKNLLIAVNLCRVLAKYPVERVVFFSSAAVYGEDIHNTNINEETPPQPTSYYGLAKYTSEVLLRKTVGLTKSSSLVLLRPALVYGPGDQGGYGPTGFVKAALAREPITLWGDGLEQREFIYVGDLVRVVHGLTFQDFDGVINVVSGKSYTFQDALNIVNGLAPLEKPTASRPRTKNKADHGFDNSRLRSLLPGFQFTPLAEGVRHTLEAVRRASA
jgi:nucleoside-diphosphate-sugar epimerase